MTAKIKLTPARRRALQLLAILDRGGRTMRVSNVTNEAFIYWQTADWLVGQGLAVLSRESGGDYVQLTDAGRSVASAL